MNQYDIQRIENALWVLGKYYNELQETCAYDIIDGVRVTPWEALKILDSALYILTQQEDKK